MAPLCRHGSVRGTECQHPSCRASWRCSTAPTPAVRSSAIMLVISPDSQGADQTFVSKSQSRAKRTQAGMPLSDPASIRGGGSWEDPEDAFLASPGRASCKRESWHPIRLSPVGGGSDCHLWVEDPIVSCGWRIRLSRVHAVRKRVLKHASSCSASARRPQGLDQALKSVQARKQLLASVRSRPCWRLFQTFTSVSASASLV
eukprot:286388-Chlamydomonas_euryale.AAC.2